MPELAEVVVTQILEDINAVSRSEDENLIALADELAEGVDAEREAEITELLPFPYTIEEQATAQIGETIRVPRMTVVTASWTPDIGWVTSAPQGRRMRRKKAECAVGSYMLADNDFVMAARVVILWRRDREE